MLKFIYGNIRSIRHYYAVLPNNERQVIVRVNKNETKLTLGE